MLDLERDARILAAFGSVLPSMLLWASAQTRDPNDRDDWTQEAQLQTLLACRTWQRCDLILPAIQAFAWRTLQHIVANARRSAGRRAARLGELHDLTIAGRGDVSQGALLSEEHGWVVCTLERWMSAPPVELRSRARASVRTFLRLVERLGGIPRVSGLALALDTSVATASRVRSQLCAALKRERERED